MVKQQWFPKATKDSNSLSFLLSGPPVWKHVSLAIITLFLALLFQMSNTQHYYVQHYKITGLGPV